MIKLQSWLIFDQKPLNLPLGKKSIFGLNTNIPFGRKKNILLKASNGISVSENVPWECFRPPNGPATKKVAHSPSVCYLPARLGLRLDPYIPWPTSKSSRRNGSRAWWWFLCVFFFFFLVLVWLICPKCQRTCPALHNPNLFHVSPTLGV